MAAESLLAFVSCSRDPARERGDADDDQEDKAMVGALLLNEAIGHLRAVSKAEIRAVIVNVEGAGDGG